MQAYIQQHIQQQLHQHTEASNRAVLEANNRAEEADKRAKNARQAADDALGEIARLTIANEQLASAVRDSSTPFEDVAVQSRGAPASKPPSPTISTRPNSKAFRVKTKISEPYRLSQQQHPEGSNSLRVSNRKFSLEAQSNRLFCRKHCLAI